MAAFDWQQPGDCIEEGCFTTATGAYNRYKLTLLYPQIQPLNGCNLLLGPLHKIFNPDISGLQLYHNTLFQEVINLKCIGK
jgi:hypothetical protein